MLSIKAESLKATYTIPGFGTDFVNYDLNTIQLRC